MQSGAERDHWIRLDIYVSEFGGVCTSNFHHVLCMPLFAPVSNFGGALLYLLLMEECIPFCDLTDDQGGVKEICTYRISC
jgi:hypothetical protein